MERFGFHIKGVKLSLKDNARHTAHPQARDGRLEFKAWECEYEKVCSDKIFWRGSLKFRGQNLGPLISEALECVNENIKFFNIPTWQIAESLLAPQTSSCKATVTVLRYSVMS
ncbi:MAG: hypothetical protein Q7R43_06050 [Candidatus Daviesbacteria bacterium]|nr:hypothetical protein [Candidatus Daviesbacteria bacterium]